MLWEATQRINALEATVKAQAVELAAYRAMGWQPIDTAPLDGLVRVYAPAYEGLPAIECTAEYHEDAGWCVDELRQVTHWRPLTIEEYLVWADRTIAHAHGL